MIPMSDDAASAGVPRPALGPSAASDEVALPSTMRAAVQDGYGGADVIEVDRLSVPTIGDGEVLLRVAAAGIDRGTWHLLTGRPYLVRLAIGLRRPRQV